MLFDLPHREFGIQYLLVYVNRSHFLLSDVIYRHFSLPPFSCSSWIEYLRPCALILLKTWRYITRLLTYLHTGAVKPSWRRFWRNTLVWVGPPASFSTPTHGTVRQLCRPHRIHRHPCHPSPYLRWSVRKLRQHPASRGRRNRPERFVCAIRLSTDTKVPCTSVLLICHVL